MSKLGVFLAVVSATLNAFGQSELPIAAQVNQAPQINGKVEGSVWQMQGQGFNLNSSAEITGDWLLPGTPSIHENGSPIWSGILDGTGSTSPSGYTIYLNSGAKLGHIIQKTDPVAFESFGNPPAATGSRTVYVNQPGDVPGVIGEWATLKNLTLNSGGVTVEVPAGSYGNFSANGSGGVFVLGTEGATEPETYNFQQLTLNSNTGLHVRGPVILHVKNSVNVNSGVVAGNAAQPGWLELQASGGLTINSGGTLYGFVQAPSKTVMVNGLLVGGVVSANQLTVNSGGVIRGVEASSGGDGEFAIVISPESGPAPLSVSFKILNGDPLIQYQWDYGDGVLETGNDLTHAYPTAGYYLATLTMLDGTDDPARVNALISVGGTAPTSCPLYPIALPKALLDATAPGATVTNLGGGNQPGNFGWLSWEGSNGNEALVNSLTPPGNSNLYVNPDDAGDTIIDLGDWIQGMSAVSDSSELRDALDALIGVEIKVPVWSETRGQGSTAAYRAAGAARIKLVSYDLTGEGQVSFQFIGYDGCGGLNSRPTVEITEPENAQVFQSAQTGIAIRSNAADSDGTITKVMYFADTGTGNLFIGEGTGTDFLFTWTPPDAGVYRLTAAAIDNQGLAEASSSISITVNALPTVAITAPGDGSVVSDGGAISVTATAEDTDGTIEKVEFFADSGSGPVKIGEDTAAPYLVSWADPGSGTYELTAKAIDDAGGTATSDPVSITVNQLPSVAITSPASGTVYQEPGSFTVTADAADADGSIMSVEFFLDGTSVGSDVSVPYTVDLADLAPGDYELTARVVDNLGGTSVSPAVAVSVNAAPTVSLTFPTDGTVIAAPGTPALTAMASDADGAITLVEFFVDGTKVGEDATAPYSFTTEELTGGEYTISARATDDRGGVATSEPVSLLIDERPSVAITRPTSGAVIPAPGTVVIEADANDSDGTVASVRFFVGGMPVGEDVEAPYTVTVDDLPAGQYTITAAATDNHGFAANAEAVTIVVNAPPVTSITSPADGNVFTDQDTIVIEASALDSDGTIARVEFWANGEKIGEDTTASYTFTWETVPAGTYALTVRAIDNLGSTVASSEVHVVVNAPPTVSLTSPTPGSVFQQGADIALAADALDADGAVTQVEFLANTGSGYISLGVDSDSPFTWTWTTPAAGNYSVIARVTDDHGAQIDSVPVAVTVNAPSTVTITNPTEGSTFELGTPVPISVAAEDSDGSVTLVVLYADDGTGPIEVGRATGEPFDFTWAPATEGTYSLHAEVTDNQGGMVASAPVSVVIGAATVQLVEGSDYVKAAEWDLVVPENPGALAIPYHNLAFDTTDVSGINDALELVLLDENGTPLDATTGDRRESIYNVTEGETPRLAAGVGSEVVDDVTRVYVNVSTLTPGTSLKLIARLLNNDSDTETSVAFGEVGFVALDGLPSLEGTDQGPPVLAAQPVSLDGLTAFGGAGVQYGVTSGNTGAGELVVEAALFNQGAVALTGRVVMVVDLPDGSTAQVANPDGVTAEGLPYFNFGSGLPGTGLPVGAVTSARPIVFANPDQAPITYQVTLLAEGNHDPVWDSLPPHDAVIDKPLSYAGHATDSDGDTITYALISGPSGLSIDPNSGVVTWTPTALGSSSVVLEATDGRGGSARQSFTIVVLEANANQAPAFTSVPVVDAVPSADYLYTALAADPDGDSLTYTLVSGPAGMGVSGTSGQLTWLPTSSQIGEHDVLLQVADGRGGTATQSFKVRVGEDPLNHAPAFVTSAPTAFNVGTPGTPFGPVNPDSLVLNLPTGTIKDQNVSITASLTGNVTPHVVFIVDESASMSDEQAWISNAVLNLDGALNRHGIFNAKYSLVGYNGGYRFINASNLNGAITLIGPRGGQVDSRTLGNPNSQGGPIVLNALPESGTYLIKVDTSQTGPYSLRSEVRTTDQSVSLTGFDQEYQGTLAPNEEVTYTLSGSSQSQVWLDPQTVNTGSVTAQMLTPSGSSVTMAGFVTLPESGDYRLIFRGGNSGGTYHYVPKSFGGGTPIELNTEISFANPSYEPTAFFKITLTEEQTLQFARSASSPYDAINWALYNSYGERLHFEYDLHTFEETLPAGTYILSVQGVSHETIYSFAVSAPRDVTKPMVFGEEVTGEIAEPYQRIRYAFDGEVGDVFMCLYSHVAASGMRMQVVSSSGSQVWDLTSFNPLLTLVESGTYYLEVYADNGATGTYDFRMDDAKELPDLTAGQAYEMEEGSQYYFKYEGKAGEYIYSYTTDGYTPWNVYGPDGNRISPPGEVWDEIDLYLPGDGTYYFYREPYEPLRFEFYSDPPEDAPESQIGVIIEGTFTPDGDNYRELEVNGPAGKWLWMDGLASEGALHLYLDTYEESIQLDDLSQDGGFFKLGPPGSTYAQIYAYDSTGSYRFRFLDFDDAEEVVYNTETSGTLDAPNASKIFRLPKRTGETLVETQDGTEGVWHVINHLGNTVSTIANGQNFVVEMTGFGDYFLVFEGASQSGNAAYHFRTTRAETIDKGLVTLGVPVQGTYAVTGETHLYHFNGTPGQALLYNGSLVKVPESGEYVIKLGPGVAGEGYSFTLQDFASLPEWTGVNSVLPNTSGGIRYYRYEGQRGDRLAIEPRVGTALSAAAAASRFRLESGFGNSEDGYIAMSGALTLPFDENESIHFVLVTDDDRGALDFRTAQDMINELSPRNVTVDAVVSAEFADGANDRALGVDATGQAYLADGSGGFTTSTGGHFVRYVTNGQAFPENVKRDYVNVSWATGGASWDLNLLRLGGVDADSFSTAFGESVATGIVGESAAIQVIASDDEVQFENLTGVLAGVPAGQDANFLVRFTGDDAVRDFDIMFVNNVTGELLGAIPVLLNDSYRYHARAIDADGDVLTYSLASGPANAQIDPQTGAISWAPSGGGTSNFTIKVSDGRGGEALQSFQVTVQSGQTNHNPIISSHAPTSGEFGKYYGYRIQASDPDGHPLSYFLDQAPDGMVIDTTFGLVSWTPGQTQIGTHAVKVRVIDRRGGVATQSFNVTVRAQGTNHQPVFTSTPPTSVTVPDTYRYQILATDADSDALSFSLATGPVGMAVDASSGVLVWQPRATDAGTFDVIVRAEDNRGGTAIQTFQISVDGANYVPIFSSIPVGQAVVDRVYEYRAEAQDADGDTISYDLQQEPPGFVSFDEATGKLRLRPSAGDIGVHSITILARDGRGGEASQTYSLNIVADAPNQAPVVVSTPPSRVRLGDTLYYILKVEDPDADPVTYELLQGPNGLSVSEDGFVVWKPTGDQFGSHAVEIEISDGINPAIVHAFNLEVVSSNSNLAPVISSTPREAAVLGVAYAYDVEANDPDGDALAYLLQSGPRGLSLDALRGTLRWIPQADQLGAQTVSLQIIDNHGGLAEQSFTIVVRGTNLPPQIVSRPSPEAAVNMPYAQSVQALDPENDPLTFRLVQAPAGLVIDDQSGEMTWTPSLAQIGVHAVELIVEDGLGGTASLAFDMIVREHPLNQPPTLTGEPVVDVAPGADYQTQFTAQDPEEGNVTFSLVAAPEGMSIDPSTGVISWTAPSTSGEYDVTVLVRDPDEGVATFTYRIHVAPNTAPVFTSTPPANAVSGKRLVYRATATDADSDPLNYQVVAGPVGTTASVTGDITWPIPLNYTGDQSFTIRVVDRRGASATQSYTVHVTPDTTGPNVALVIARNPVQIGETVAVQAQATDDGTIADLQLLANGVPVAINEYGIATFTSEVGATYSLVVTAKDTAGNTASTTPQELRFIDPSDTNGPDVVLDLDPFQATQGLVYELMDLVGSVTDDNLESYRVEYAPVSEVDTANPAAADPDYRLLAQGTENVDHAPLAQIDPTTLANDSYFFRVVARDYSGNITVQGVVLTVAGQLKLGRMAYAVTDLNIPLVGIPIQITRVYDSLEAHRSGDFGFGWSMALREAHIQESVPQYKTGQASTVPDLLGSTVNSFKLGTRVTLTGPDGRRVSFRFVPVPADLGIPGLPPGAGLFGSVWKPRFVPEPGVYDKLEAPDALLQMTADGTFVGYVLPTSYNPDTYTLTTKDGTKYRYDQNEGLKSITDRSKNVVTFTHDGIFHSSGAAITFTRDSQDRITAITDPAGHSIGYHYDDRGDLDKVTDQEGREVSFSYYPNTEYPDAPAHYLEKLLDADGNPLTTATYDPGTGQLSTVTDGNGHTTYKFYYPEYRGEEKLDFVTVAEGDVQEYWDYREYDERGNVVYHWDPMGRESFWEYTDQKNPDSPTKIIPPCGCPTTYTYDANGNVLTQTTPKGETTTTTYDAFDNPLSSTDALGRTTRYAYDNNGVMNQLTDAAGNVTRLTPNSTGRVDAVRDARGITTTFEYDGGNPADPLKISKPTKVTYANGDTLRFTYGPWGNVTSFTDPSGATQQLVTQQLVTDEAGMLKQRILPPTDENPDPAVTQYDYNTRGQLERVTNARSETTEFTYDEVGRLRFRKDANDNVTEFTWDELGRLKKTIDPLNRVKERFYRADGRVALIRQADGTEIHFEYDINGNRTALIDPNDNRTEFRYDGNNRLIEQIDPLGRSTFYEYDAVGNVTKITDRLQRVRLFEYDALDRQVKETWVSPAGEVVKEIAMDYDASGNLVRAYDDVSDYAMTYDNRGRVDVITAKYPGQDDFILDYDYDDANRTSTVTDNAGISVTTITDPRAQLRSILWQGTPAGPVHIDMGYNQLGDKTSTHRYTGLAANPADLVFETEYRFERGLTDIGAFAIAYNSQDSRGAIDQLLSTESFGPLDIQPDAANVLQDSTHPLSRLTRIANTRADGSALSSYEYVYDTADQLDEATEDGEFLDYGYDAIGQLRDVARSVYNAEVYRYDDAGNRLRTDDQATDNLIEEGNRIVGDGTHSYGYDNEGNRTSKTEIATGATWFYTYDHRNRMTEARQETSAGAVIQTVTFAYDALDRRVEKALDADPVRYTYMGDMIWSRTDATNGKQHFLSSGTDQWFARADAASMKWYDTDRMGTARRVIDATGTILAERVYSSFGEKLVDSDPSVFGEIGFTGRQYDSETENYYYRARYFDPNTGSFISEDPLGRVYYNPVATNQLAHDALSRLLQDHSEPQFSGFNSGDFNAFRFGFNNPVTYLDPSGLSANKGTGEYMMVVDNKVKEIEIIHRATGQRVVLQKVKDFTGLMKMAQHLEAEFFILWRNIAFF